MLGPCHIGLWSKRICSGSEVNFVFDERRLSLTAESAPSQQKQTWVAAYVALWFLSFAVFCVLHSAANSLSFDPTQFGEYRFLLNAAAGFGPWIISFGAGLLLSGLSIMVARPETGSAGAFWKRALAIAWAPALFFLYSGWHVASLKGKEEQAFLGKVVEIRDRHSQKIRAEHSSFAAEVEKLDIPGMLSAEVLVSQPGITRNRAKLAKLEQLVDQQDLRAHANTLALQRELTELGAGQMSGSEIRSSLDSAIKERTDLESQILATQRRFIGVLSEFNDFMSARIGRAAIQGGAIRFETEDEARKYNSYVQETMNVAKHEADLLARFQKMNERGAQTLDSLRR